MVLYFQSVLRINYGPYYDIMFVIASHLNPNLIIPGKARRLQLEWSLTRGGLQPTAEVTDSYELASLL